MEAKNRTDKKANHSYLMEVLPYAVVAVNMALRLRQEWPWKPFAKRRRINQKASPFGNAPAIGSFI